MSLKRRCSYVALLAASLFAVSVLTGCSTPSPYCPARISVDLSEADSYANDIDSPFRFPLDNVSGTVPWIAFAVYGYSNTSPDTKEFHAAEDYDRDPGSPVYAMADGVVSFSGPMGGYGWLIIIDHPDFNLYSLYGHLSPSLWYIKSGVQVEKGRLIAYLGDSYENGGSEENPLTPHLHFGIRAGQRSDYPSMGEWGWQAGWIKYCPQELGWLQPSLIITNQAIPSGGFKYPEASFLAIWWSEGLISSLILVAILLLGFQAMFRKNKIPIFVGLSIASMIFATWFSFNKELKISYVLLTICILLAIVEAYRLIKVFQRR